MRLATDNWCVRVDEKVYGPYSSQQLRKFAHEGRLASWSLIAPAGSRTWRPARDETTFASFFGENTANTNKIDGAFGKRTDVQPAQNIDENNGVDKIRVRPRSRHINAPQAAPANFIVIFDVVSAAASRVEAAMTSLGPAFRLAENVWTVQCSATAVGVRNAVAPYLRARESIFVIDSTHGRTSWQNYTPEAHAKISAAWQYTKQ